MRFFNTVLGELKDGRIAATSSSLAPAKSGTSFNWATPGEPLFWKRETMDSSMASESEAFGGGGDWDWSRVPRSLGAGRAGAEEIEFFPRAAAGSPSLGLREPRIMPILAGRFST